MDLYYLTCKHSFEAKLKEGSDDLGYNVGDQGVREENPLRYLIETGHYMQCAQWLYSAMIPGPKHSDNLYSYWYLTQLTKKDGWTVIACQNETTRIPIARQNETTGLPYDEVKCPFLAVRKLPSGVGEAVLAIRGSSEGMDWSINFDLDPIDFSYNGTNGSVHQGMQLAAQGILQIFGMQQQLMRFHLMGSCFILNL